jgi:YHS domain-containing protein
MKAVVMFASLAIGFGAVVAVHGADDAKPDAKTETKTEAKADDKAPATAPSTQAAIFNKTCPVGGDDVDPKVKTVTYKGKTIGFCCEECIADFKKDPDKYGKKLGIK